MTDQNFITLPASSLVLSTKYQSRKKPSKQMTLQELADSILSQGLLQNLVVIKSKKKGIYEVIAGGRRLTAIKILIDAGHLAKDWPILVLLKPESEALTASITENTHREDLHPADEFEAFAKLIEQGKAIEDIAAKFGVAPALVKRRLRLAAVAPELIAEYRAEEMTLEVLMAFTLSDDQQRQRDVWAGMSRWQRNHAHTVRDALTSGKLTASNSIVRFISVNAYEEAGGQISRDLFAEANDPSGVYLHDRSLVEQLALQKLVTHAEELCHAGWGWAESRLKLDHDEWRSHGRVHPTKRELTKAEAKQIAELEQEMIVLSAQMENVKDADDETSSELYWQLETTCDNTRTEIQQIELNARVWPAEMMRVAGCVLSINHEGKIQIEHGMLRPKDRAEITEVVTAAGNETGMRMPSLPAPVTRPVHSERLVKQLSAHKVGIVQASLANQHHIALAVLVAQLAELEFVGSYRNGFGLGIRRDCENLDDVAPDWQGSKAQTELQSIRLHWLDQLPKNADGEVENLLAWAVDQDQDTLVELLAFLVAGSVQGIRYSEPNYVTELDELATINGIKMSDWWIPTADSYFAHVSKDRIIDVIASGVSAETAVPLAKMKKAEAAQAAEAAIAGKNWLPEILHIKTANN